MLKCSHATLTFVSGLVWLFAGISLFSLGLQLLLGPLFLGYALDTRYPVINYLAPYLGGFPAIGLLLAISLCIGYFKGRYVLGKSAHKGVLRIRQFPNPTSLARIYSAKYYLLLGGMMGLGFSIKFFGLPNDIRGFIDAAIGLALLYGSTIYFNQAFGMRQVIPPTS